MLRLEPSRHHVHQGAGVVDGAALFQEADRGQAALVAWSGGCGSQGERHPDLGALGKREAARGDACDGAGLPIDQDLPTDDLWILIEYPLP